ncbi:MAG: hypothetical protein Kow0077_21370 [Anaerolineae bacterium]
MAELTQVLGAILKDVAQSRVISDLFSRDASLQYAQDPILVNFPVPRVEIKEASIQLKFAVNAVEEAPVDTDSLTQAGITQLADDLSTRMYAVLVEESEKREDLEAFLEEQGIDLPALVSDVVVRQVKANPQMVATALGSKPQVLAKKLDAEVLNALRGHEALWAMLRKTTRVRDLREQITANTLPSVNRFVEDVAGAISAAGRQALHVDVAVTREELADLPDVVLSHVSIVTEIRNYEWTEVGSVDGKPVRRLQPE